MTLKEYEEEKSKKSRTEFIEWFDKIAWYAVDIGGIEQPCIKLTSRKVALRDGSIYVNDKDKEIRRMEENERHSLRERYNLMKTYDEIAIWDRMSIKDYLELLVRKTEMERILKQKEELPEGTIFCSFCGKSQEDVRKLVAGPANVFICDECIEVCGEIMEEELEEEK